MYLLGGKVSHCRARVRVCGRLDLLKFNGPAYFVFRIYFFAAPIC